MYRLHVTAFIASLLLLAGPSLADEVAGPTQINKDVQEYIAAITKAADENQHSCIADKWESDQDLNADSGITDADLAALLNPPQS